MRDIGGVEPIETCPKVGKPGEAFFSFALDGLPVLCALEASEYGRRGVADGVVAVEEDRAVRSLSLMRFGPRIQMILRWPSRV